MKQILIVGAVVLVAFVGVLWSRSPVPADPDLVSARGLHTHPRLAIYVKGEPVLIPSDIGIGTQYAAMPTYDPQMRMTAIHTHAEGDGTIHLEFPGRVTREDLKLKHFFAIWGKDLMSFGEEVVMTVNGVSSQELGEYEMQDGDVIELRYE